MASTAPKPTRRRLGENTKLLYEEAERLNVPFEGLSREEVRAAVDAAWNEENREAIEASNAWVEKNGLPLAKYRLF